MSIKITGLNELNKTLDGLAGGLKTNTISHWGKRIESSAKHMCNDINGDRIQVTVSGYSNTIIHYSAKDEAAADCLISATRSHLHSMPMTTRMIFERTAKEYKYRRNRIA